MKKILTLLLTAALCLGLFLPASARGNSIYLTAVNQSLVPPTADTIPYWSGGVLYVHYSLFDENSSGGGLDLYASYSRNSATVTLFSLRKILVFDLDTGGCRDDISGETLPTAGAILRNGQPFLPLEAVCEFFGLTYSTIGIRQGTLIRLKSDSVVLSDAKFIDAAEDLIDRRVREYQQSIAEAQLPVTTQPVEEDVSATDVRTYLAFHCDSGESVAKLADVLDQNRLFALFFLTPGVMEENGDLVRRLVGTGHSVGVLAQGSSLEETRTLLDRGRALLEENALLRTTLACVPKDQRRTIEGEGWVCWTETISLNPTATVGPNTFAAGVLGQLEGRTRSTYLTLPGNDRALRVLPVLLRQLRQSQFVVSIPMETRL